jgi:hypothetical protein
MNYAKRISKKLEGSPLDRRCDAVQLRKAKKAPRESDVVFFEGASTTAEELAALGITPTTHVVWFAFPGFRRIGESARG